MEEQKKRLKQRKKQREWKWPIQNERPTRKKEQKREKNEGVM